MQAIGFLPPDLGSKLYSLSVLHVTKLTVLFCCFVSSCKFHDYTGCKFSEKETSDEVENKKLLKLVR